MTDIDALRNIVYKWHENLDYAKIVIRRGVGFCTYKMSLF